MKRGPAALANDSWEALLGAHAAMIRRLQADEVWVEVSMREYDVLYTLSKCPEPIRLGELQRHVLLSQPALSRMVDRLVRRGLIARESDPADAAETILNELGKFSPALLERERWLVLNKADQILDEEREERLKHIVERLDWKGPVYVISALESEGTDALSKDIMRYLDERDQRIAEDPEYAQALEELNQRIEDEARARLQALDDRRALRRAGLKSVDDVDDDDFDDYEDDEDGPEIIYVRD